MMGQIPPVEVINLIRYPNTIVPVAPTPSIDPLSVISNSFEVLYVGGNKVIIISMNNIENVEIIITNETSVMYSEENDLTTDENLVISTMDWRKGDYYIYMYVGTNVYIGVFRK